MAPLVMLVGFLVVKTAIEHRWVLFSATVLAGSVVCWFCTIVIRDCFAGYEDKEK